MYLLITIARTLFVTVQFWGHFEIRENIVTVNIRPNPNKDRTARPGTLSPDRTPSGPLERGQHIRERSGQASHATVLTQAICDRK